MDETQRIAYDALVEEAGRSYAEEQNGLVWCKDCREINLWTYWQGRNADRVKLLLVGQDWGSVYTQETKNWVKRLCSVPRGENFPYLEGNKSLTDENLVALFKSIGYNVDKNEEKNRALFFTNLVLGYRTESRISGNYKRAWAKHDGPYFRRLVHILAPEYIFCLGRNTFEGVLTALELPRPAMSGYNRFLVSGENPVPAVLPDGTKTHICALAHCGGMGTANRNRGGERPAHPLDRQKADWHWVLRDSKSL